MRLIDVDALIDDLKHDVAADQDSLDYEELTDSNREIIQFDKDCKQNAIDLLQNAPTIEPERKKGKWIHGREMAREMIRDCTTAIFYEGWTCSECGCLVEKEREPWYKYCPNCGSYNGGDKDDQL